MNGGSVSYDARAEKGETSDLMLYDWTCNEDTKKRKPKTSPFRWTKLSRVWAVMKQTDLFMIMGERKASRTFGAFSAFSFLTSSPCWETRVYGQELGSDAFAVEADAAGGAAAEVGGAMPGL